MTAIFQKKQISVRAPAPPADARAVSLETFISDEPAKEINGRAAQLLAAIRLNDFLFHESELSLKQSTSVVIHASGLKTYSVHVLS
jgi:hypothetical protein